jgi:hypothetical protein
LSAGETRWTFSGRGNAYQQAIFSKPKETLPVCRQRQAPKLIGAGRFRLGENKAKLHFEMAGRS